MISITPKDYDIDGGVVFYDVSTNSGLTERSRRVQRTATLDGGSVFSDFGFADSDREMTVIINTPARADADLLFSMVENHSRLFVSTDEASFEVVPVTVRTVGAELRFRCQVVAKAS